MAESLRSEVWLLQSRVNPFPVRGEMALDDGRVTVAKLTLDM